MAKEKDQEFLEFIIKNLVEKADAVKVSRKVDEMGVLLELTVDKDDMGRVIGKSGNTVNAVRSLLRVIGSKENARLNLKITEPEGSEMRKPVEETAPESEEVQTEAVETSKETEETEETEEAVEVVEVEEEGTSAVEEAKKEVEELEKELED